MKHISLLREAMERLGMDAILSYDELNQRFLSGFAFTDGAILITKTRCIMITDFRYYEHAGKEAYPCFEIVMPKDRTSYISEVFASEEVTRVGLEGRFLPFAKLNALREKHPTVAFGDIGDTIEILRQIKTPEEIILMQRAQDITDTAFSHVLGMLTPNMKEIEVAAELEYAMRKMGASGFAFDTIAVSGDASALPHGTPRNEKLHAGFLTMDFGAKFSGYCSDMTRTVVIGRATPEIKDVYHTVRAAQAAALDFLREGVDCAEADKVARDIIDAKYPGTFGHSLGHSVGLFIHEAPSLSTRGGGRTVRVGEILTVEPGIYLQGKYGCRIEDMVAIEKDGIYNFTHSTKDLIEIL